MKRRNAVWIRAAVALLVMAGITPAARAEDGQAVAALSIALQRESSAHLAYLAYAAKADAECRAQIATLFRALAAAEDVHVRNHVRALEQMDVTPKTVAESIVVGTTAENLAAAIDAEGFERRVAYPQFMALASDECLYDVLASFRYARDAEATHAIRLSLALAQLQEGGPEIANAAGAAVPPPTRITYYVCPGCGCVRSERLAHQCRCGTAADRSAVFAAPESGPASGLLARRS